MKKTNYSILVALILTCALYQSAFTQSQSEYAPIRLPIFKNPLIWKLTTAVTNQYWNIDLFLYPRAGDQSYLMDPTTYQLLTAMSFDMDYAWHRMIYQEALDNWIRGQGDFGSANCQYKWPWTINVLAPFDDYVYSYYYYVYGADDYHSRIVRLAFDWISDVWVCNPPITGGGLYHIYDIDLNDGFDFWPHTNDYLWVINGQSEIKRMTIDGVLKSTFGASGCEGAPGTFCKLTAIVSGRSPFLSEPYDIYANTDHVYVADAGNNRVVRLIKNHVTEAITWMNEVPAGAGVIDLEVDALGHLWVVDREAGTITKYTYDLFPLCTFGSTGIGENQFVQPVSLSAHVGFLGASSMVVAEDWSDSTGMQFFALGTDVLDLEVTSTPEEHVHTIHFVLVDFSQVSVKVYDDQGGLVRTLFDGGLISGDPLFVWDGTDESDIQQPTGNYRVEIIDSSVTVIISTGEPINVVTKEAWFHHNYNCCDIDGIRGDADNDCTAGCVTVADLSYLTSYLFQQGPVPACLTEANADGLIVNGSPVDVGDLSYLVTFLFLEGPPPPPCP